MFSVQKKGSNKGETTFCSIKCVSQCWCIPIKRSWEENPIKTVKYNFTPELTNSCELFLYHDTMLTVEDCVRITKDCHFIFIKK